MSAIEELEKLATLKEKGIISADEFEEQKKKILEKKDSNVAETQAKSRLVYILLALFCGGLGIHNFYAGYTGKAVAQLLLTIFLFWLIIPVLAVFVWVLVEIVTVTKDAKGVPFN